MVLSNLKGNDKNGKLFGTTPISLLRASRTGLNNTIMIKISADIIHVLVCYVVRIEMRLVMNKPPSADLCVY